MDPREAVYAALTAQHVDRTIGELAGATSLPEPEVAAIVQDLIASGRAEAITDSLFLSDVAAKRLRDTARRTLSTFHKRNPYVLALPIGELHASLTKAARVRAFDALLDRLGAEGIATRESKRVRSSDHAVILPPTWQVAAETMLPVFEAGGLTDPPWPGNFSANFPRDIPVKAVLDALAERGELVRLADDLYISISAMESVKSTIRELAATGEPITVAAVRDRTGSSRRVVVPLLEWLDKQGFMERRGESRTLLAAE